ncbi:MAG: endonuclease/exonuclease/phosphatase family protein [Rhodobacter sp.]|nr:endonuclease/exonuclease/phosphatase family protein [Rhodobacter sp.]
MSAAAVWAEPLRIATWHVELTRKGPGLLLRDILKGDAQVEAVVAGVAEAAPDILLLTAIDYDLGLVALGALADRLEAAGAAYPHRFALRPNAGLMTALDLDGDDRLGGPRDAQGYGRFAGHGGMAVLSRLPIAQEEVRDFSALLWADLPGALLPEADGQPFPSAAARAVQRLSSTGHWDLPVRLPGGERLHLLAFAATPPVFDGPEDRNGKRNHDEIALWTAYLDGRLAQPPPAAPVVVLGNANLDPVDGEGRHTAIAGLLGHRRLQDPRPASAAGAEAARRQGGANTAHRGDPALDTADWRDHGGPGNLRVSYVLPDAGLTVLDAGVAWPERPDGGDGPPALRHRLVWVDVVTP